METFGIETTQKRIREYVENLTEEEAKEKLIRQYIHNDFYLRSKGQINLFASNLRMMHTEDIDKHPERWIGG